MLVSVSVVPAASSLLTEEDEAGEQGLNGWLWRRCHDVLIRVIANIVIIINNSTSNGIIIIITIITLIVRSSASLSPYEVDQLKY